MRYSIIIIIIIIIIMTLIQNPQKWLFACTVLKLS